ncbi:15783_t:CDS:2, partial [Funneliformis mosseae]
KDIRCTEEAIKKRCSIFLERLNMQLIPIEEDIADIHDDLKNNKGLKDYNDTVEGETQQPYSKSEDASLFD